VKPGDRFHLIQQAGPLFREASLYRFRMIRRYLRRSEKSILSSESISTSTGNIIIWWKSTSR